MPSSSDLGKLCRPCARWLAFTAILYSGCASLLGAPRTQLAENLCITRAEKKDRDPEHWGTTTLVYTGNLYLELAAQSQLDEQKIELVKYAETCYQYANNLNKYDYSSELGLGVASMMLGLLRESSVDGNMKVYLSAAKQHLGRAFILSQAHLEPLYYLAEIAKLEGDRKLANLFIKPLVKKEYKDQFSKRLFFATQSSASSLKGR